MTNPTPPNSRIKFGINEGEQGIVALTRVRVWVAEGDSIGRNHDEFMSGLFELEEWVPYEPAAYHYQDGWYVRPISDGPDKGRLERLAKWENENEDCITFFIAMDDMWAQLDPQAYGSELVQEREMEFMVDDEIAEGMR